MADFVDSMIARGLSVAEAIQMGLGNLSGLMGNYDGSVADGHSADSNIADMAPEE
jgi:hypothetical protein